MTLCLSMPSVTPVGPIGPFYTFVGMPPSKSHLPASNDWYFAAPFRDEMSRQARMEAISLLVSRKVDAGLTTAKAVCKHATELVIARQVRNLSGGYIRDTTFQLIGDKLVDHAPVDQAQR